MVTFTVSEEDYATLEAYRLKQLSAGKGHLGFSAHAIEHDKDEVVDILGRIYEIHTQIAPTALWKRGRLIWFLRENYFTAPGRRNKNRIVRLHFTLKAEEI